MDEKTKAKIKEKTARALNEEITESMRRITRMGEVCLYGEDDLGQFTITNKGKVDFTNKRTGKTNAVLRITIKVSTESPDEDRGD